MFGDIGDYVSSTFGEIKKHPLQAVGAALGVPGWDPAIGGIFNNRQGGALLSPTGNFTSSAWNEMKQDNPNSAAGLNLFHKVNSVADVVAPAVAGAYGIGSAGGLGGSSSGGGASGLTGLFSGPAAYGDSGMTGVVGTGSSGLGSAMSGDMGGALGSAPTGLFSGLLPGGGMSATSSGALGGGLSGDVAGASSLGGASMGGLDTSALSSLAQQFMNQQSQQYKQQAQQDQQQSGTSFQRLAAPQAQLTSFQPVHVYPNAQNSNMQSLAQAYAARLMNNGGY